MKLIFMGTPEFAVPTLEKLLESKHEIVAIYTRPAKKANRGHKLTNTPIYDFACSKGLEGIVRTTKTLKKSEIQEEIKNFKADAIIVCAYGLMIPTAVLEAARYGCINIHPSLLPRWRGAAPIQGTILSGDEKGGVTIMQLDEGWDTGDILSQFELPLKEGTTAEVLHDTLSIIGAELLLTTLDQLEQNQIYPRKQEESEATYIHKLDKEQGKIVWSKTAEEIDRQVRALSAMPSVYFEYKGERFKVLEVKMEHLGLEPIDDSWIGKVIDDKLGVMTGNGIIRIVKLQRSGKKPMMAIDMLRGYPIAKGEQLE